MDKKTSWAALAALGQETRLDVFRLLVQAGSDGIALTREIRNRWPDTDVIVITGYASIQNAVEAMKLGAYDYLLKPFEYDRLHISVQRAREQLGQRGRFREPDRLLALLQGELIAGGLRCFLCRRRVEGLRPGLHEGAEAAGSAGGGSAASRRHGWAARVDYTAASGNRAAARAGAIRLAA